MKRDTLPTIILVHVKGDDGAAAIAEAISQARWRQAKIVASGDASATPVYASPEARSEVAEALESAGIEYELVLARDNTAEQVLELAEGYSAELIVLSTRKRSPVMKLFNGLNGATNHPGSGLPSADSSRPLVRKVA
ncbi:universal stress protein [Renibacterium salmoninarum]|uniref:universal stress protein n=1 Tax=Renibacterium salmoninarum TaxID=1646 RepID=UPI00131447A3|nr:universal stress protein [Renibacterium salmoninarum]